MAIVIREERCIVGGGSGNEILQQQATPLYSRSYRRLGEKE
jgi:hypothetical protein